MEGFGGKKHFVSTLLFSELLAASFLSPSSLPLYFRPGMRDLPPSVAREVMR